MPFVAPSAPSPPPPLLVSIEIRFPPYTDSPGRDFLMTSMDSLPLAMKIPSLLVRFDDHPRTALGTAAARLHTTTNTRISKSRSAGQVGDENHVRPPRVPPLPPRSLRPPRLPEAPSKHRGSMF